MATNPQTCQHGDAEIRRKKDCAGRTMFRRQCLDCGTGVGSFVRQKDVPEIWNVKDWDENLERSGREESDRAFRERVESTRREWSERAEEESSEWWAWYDEYLQSEKWQDKRYRVLHRDKFQCQACLTRRATEVHHLNYKHVGNEPLFDLISVCKTCHDELTRMSRERRQAVSA